MNMEKREKFIEDYNCQDLHRIFSEEYYKKHGKEYVSSRFIGYEMKLLKGLLESHDVFAILCGIVSCIKRNSNTVHIPYFVAGIKYYLSTDDNPELQWKIYSSNQQEYIDKWKQLRMIKAKWFPKARDKRRIEELEKELMECTDEKEGTAPKKKATRTNKSKEGSR